MELYLQYTCILFKYKKGFIKMDYGTISTIYFKYFNF